ncbi:MAG: tetratricopeptide repeat protein, partial [Victivallaceae bacterium]
MRTPAVRLCAAAVLLAAAVFAAEPSPVPAADPLRDAALAGDPAAQFRLAHEFLQGVNRPANPSLGVFWFRKAAAGGSAEARFNVGICLENGFGVEKSPVLAYEEYRLAAAAGVPKA